MRVVFVDVRDKSTLAICENITNASFKTAHHDFTAVKALLMDTDTIIVISGISKPNMTKKEQFTRSIAKTLDDAYFDKCVPKSNAIFIDYISFLGKYRNYIGPIFSYFPAHAIWLHRMKSLSSHHQRLYSLVFLSILK